MNKIAGFYSPDQDLTMKDAHFKNILKNMAQAQKPACSRNAAVDEDTAEYLNSRFGLSCTGRLLIRPQGSGKAGMLYSGEIYNCQELKKELSVPGFPLSEDEADILLTAYLAWGPGFIKKVNGCFSIAVMDGTENKLFLYRDRAGTKPLFCLFGESSLSLSRNQASGRSGKSQ